MQLAILAGLIALTLLITAWAAMRGQSRDELFVADRSIKPWQNGLAITGDLLSASTLLGTIGIYFTAGTDVATYYVPGLLGIVLAMIWIAGPLRRSGKFTLGDVLTSRLQSPALRMYSGASTLVISTVYLVAQLVGAGALLDVLFGIPFELGVLLICVLTSIYTAVGGMLATTWIQLLKAILLIAAVAALCVLAWTSAGGLPEIYARAAAAQDEGWSLLGPGGMHLDGFSAASLALGQALGIMGLPHLLIRALTVPDERSARRSLGFAALLVSLVFGALLLIVAPAGVAFVKGVADYMAADGGLRGGGNTVVVHLAHAVGGPILYATVAGVAFATILAVVAGLTIATATASAHDVYAVIAHNRKTPRGELLVFRGAAVLLSASAGLLAIVFQKENVTVLVTLGLTIAACANFPVLILALYWKKLTAAGALAGGLSGLTASLGLIFFGPTVWVKVLGNPVAIFPSDQPALIAAPIGLLTAVLASLLTQRAAIRTVT